MKTPSENYLLAAVGAGILLRAALLAGAVGLLYWVFFVAGKAAQ